MPCAVIASAARTALGSFQGGLALLKSPELGAFSVSAAIQMANIKGEDVEEVIMGCVLPAGLGQAPARQAAIKAGIPNSVPAFTINKVCSSGLLSIILAEQLIRLGDRNIVVAGGMESMTNAPYLLPSARSGYRMGNGEIVDSMVFDGLWDIHTNQHMGICAENTAERYKISRSDQDEFSATSFKRALEAIKQGYFKGEIVPVTVRDKKGVASTFETDEGPGRVNFEKMPQLKPSFKKDGTVTAANSSSISDGAAALVVMSMDEANKRGIKPLAKIVGHATYSHEPEWFTTAPIGAINRLLKKTGWKLDEIDIFEVNEAFSVVTIAALRELKIPHAKTNICGGAVALGHPIGASGARIVTTLVHAMKRTKAKKGLATLCNGGGEATAIALELI